MKHGPVFTVKVRNSSFIVFAGPEAVEYLASEDGTLTGEPIWKPLVELLGGRNNITALDGEEHARLRKVMRRGFSRSAALDTITVTIDTTRRMLHKLQPGTLIPVADFTTELIAEVIGGITLGRATGEYLADFITVWRNYLWVYVLGSKPKSVLETSAYKQALERVMETGRSIIDAYERGQLQPGDSQFADDLIKAHKEQPDLVNDGDLMLGMIAPYVAGLDTVASIVLFMLYEIVRAPALQERLLVEIRGLLAADTPSAAQLRDVPLLHATAMETMRYYNVAALLPRIAKRDFKFAGHTIQAGERLQMALGVVHRLDRFYPNPEQFDIDRFLEPRNEHKQRNAFAPYGAGAHTCLGAGMAEVIMALMVATLIHDAQFAIEPPNYRVKRFVSSSLEPAPDFNLRLLALR